MYYKVFIIIFALVLSISCNKSEDYRNPYLGNYKFSVTISLFHISDSITTDTLVTYSGNITAGSQSNTIDINFLQNRWITAVLSEDGTISKVPSSGQGWGVGGRFKSTNEVLFEVFFPGSLTDTIYSVTGMK